MTSPSTITVGVDGSEAAASALAWASGFAASCGATVRAIMTWQYPYLTTLPGLVAAVPPADLMREQAEVALRDLVDGAGIDVRTEVHQGSPALVLTDASHETEPLGAGSHGQVGR